MTENQQNRLDSVSQIEKTLNSFLENEATMPQAYLFMGSSNSGSTSRKIVDEFANKITGQKTPNIDIVHYDATEGGIDLLRESLQLASLMPVQSKFKAVVMLNMDKANTQMQNALLKNLEEPPTRTIFLLVSSLPMLPTIMSRCQVFSISKTDDEQESSSELIEAMQILESKSSAGLAEKVALAGTLADYEDAVLTEVIERWLYKQTAELKQSPEKYPAVRATMETLQSLRGNFNKKMVLHKFVTSGLR